MISLPPGVDPLRHAALNKGTAFTVAERDALGLHGLLPPRVCTMEEQIVRVMENLRRKESPLEKYIFLTALQGRNQTLFYRVLIDYLEELMPIIYTPTVGEACQSYGHIYRQPSGLYVSRNDRGRIARLLRNWRAAAEINTIVVTDGERILGLGDLGANGMGISCGKLALYTACAGIPPQACLPIALDVGTENDALRADPLYLGVRERRLRGAAYHELLDEFVGGVEEVFPGALLQFEDFATENAFALLSRHRDRLPTFNDDIQGTAAMTVAGLISALRLTGGTLAAQRLLFFGAGSAATGIADLFVAMLVDEGVSPAEARRRCWFFDVKGLVVSSRKDLAAHNTAYAHEGPPVRELLATVRELRPTALIGVSGAPATFTRPVLEEMARINQRPIVFALSNPTSKAECTPAEAYGWTDGRAVVATGSPFPETAVGVRRFLASQGNNSYIFPGVGLGVVLSRARRVTDEMFVASARALARLVRPADLELGRVYPALTRIREVSLEIASAVASVAWDSGLTDRRRPADIRAFIASRMYQPMYPSYVADAA
ncbi:MAG: NAD-dependent malic enzyme [Deltaproteobacteria bacterium]|nr:MAG: NAD-dependent malic enzyme [Deltaproteobacteria bacterium]